MFLGTYLLLQGWPEGHIGVISFIKDIVSLFFQTPMGDVIDKTTKKREYLYWSDIILAIGGMTIMFYPTYAWVSFWMVVKGIVLTVIPPALYGVTLGMIGSHRLPEQSSLNETYKHAGTAVYALLAGITSYYGEDYMIFVLVLISALVAVPLVLRIKPEMIDDNKARGLVPNNDGVTPNEASSYMSIVSDRNIVVLLVSVLMFHLGNAAMLPLLSQLLALDNSSTGILVTAVNICIAQLLIIPSALLVGQKSKIWGTKNIFLLAMIIIPFRGCIILACLHHPGENTAMLISTQLLDGVSAGFFSVVIVLITEQLTRGSGRFNFVFGMVNTAQAVGGAFSNLVAQVIAEQKGYSGAFVFLTVMAILPVIVFGLMMPSSIVSASHIDEFPETLDTPSMHGAWGAPGGKDKNYNADEEMEIVFRPDETAVTSSGGRQQSKVKSSVEMTSPPRTAVNPMHGDVGVLKL